MTALPREILRMRDQLWRRRRQLRLRSSRQARTFVRKVGFCLFWPTSGIELPNLLQAIAGNARPLTSGYDDPAIGRSWNWKDEALDKRWWYYGKLVRRRATLVSLDLLPSFYALSENYGDPQDYLVEYQEGRLSAEAKSIYEVLLQQGPMDTVRLRAEARLASTSVKARFDRALVDLQAGLKVLPVGVAEAGAWRYAFIYELVDRWHPQVPDQARALSVGEARRRILRQLLGNLMVADRAGVARILGWRGAEVARTLDRMLEAGEVVEVDLGEGPARLALKSVAGRVRRGPRSGKVGRAGRNVRPARQTGKKVARSTV